MKLYCTNLISKCFGKFADTQFIKPLQVLINKAYVKLMKVDMTDFEAASSYKSLNALFTRKLLKPRTINNDIKSYISPCDSVISAIGTIEADKAMQIKGFSYHISELLLRVETKQLLELKNGQFINFYLAPNDYHRFHAPIDMQVLKLIHIPGLLYPVNFKYLNSEHNLFVKNERVILECQDTFSNIFYMVFVGALNVGRILINFEKNLHSNHSLGIKTFEYSNSVNLVKGEELGTFKMGSTIVMLFKKGAINLQNSTDDKVRFGDIMGVVS